MNPTQLSDFINQYKGQTNVGNTDVNRGQCVGLVSVYMDALSIPHEWGDAKDLLANADPKYFKIVNNDPNDYSQFPPVGAVIVWGDTWGNGAGHTAIVTNANGNNFSSFEQNDHTTEDPTGACETLFHADYSGVLGWLIPITQPSSAIMYKGIDITNQESVKVCVDMWDAVVNQKEYVATSVYNHDVAQKETTITLLTGQLNEKNTTLTQQTTEISTLKGQVLQNQTDMGSLQDQANQSVTNHKLYVQSQSDLSKARLQIDELISRNQSLQKEIDGSKPVGFWNKLKFLFG